MKSRGRLYVDTGADVSLIKQKYINRKIAVNNGRLGTISGIPPGESTTLGSINKEGEAHTHLTTLLTISP